MPHSVTHRDGQTRIMTMLGILATGFVKREQEKSEKGFRPAKKVIADVNRLDRWNRGWPNVVWRGA